MKIFISFLVVYVHNRAQNQLFFSRRHLAPKFSKVVAKSIKLVANFFSETKKELYEKCIKKCILSKMDT